MRIDVRPIMNILKLKPHSIVKQLVIAGFLIFFAYHLILIISQGDIKTLSFFALGLLLFIFVWQQWILLYIFIIAYVWFFDYFWYTEKPLLYIGVNVYLCDVFILLFAGSTIILAMRRGGHPGFRSSLGKAIALFIAWAIICIIRGIPVWGHSAIGESRFVIWTWVYFPVVYTIKNMYQFKKFLNIFLFVVISYLTYLFSWRFFIQFQGDLGEMLRSRLMGADLALLVVSIFVFCLIFLLSGTAKKHRVSLILFTFFCAVLIPFGARTGWIAWSISTVFVVFILLRERGLKAYLPFLIFSTALLILFWYLGLFTTGGRLDPDADQGLIFLTEQGQQKGTAGWRLMGWSRIIEQSLRESFIFGQGFGEYYDIFYFYEKGVPPHNDWLIIFSKMGLIGLIMFVIILIQFYKTGFNYIKQTNDKKSQAYMKGLLVVFLTGLVGGTFFFFFPFTWLAAGLQTALLNISREVPSTKVSLI